MARGMPYCCGMVVPCGAVLPRGMGAFVAPGSRGTACADGAATAATANARAIRLSILCLIRFRIFVSS
jgi:hypothetical protein